MAIQTKYYNKRFFLRKVDSRNYHPIIMMKINGISVRMLVDTGSGTTLIGTEFIKDLNLIVNNKKESATTGVGVTKEITSQVTIKKFEITPRLVIKDLKIYSINLDYVNDYYKERGKKIIHGLIGSDLLKKLRAKVDYVERIVEFQTLENI